MTTIQLRYFTVQGIVTWLKLYDHMDPDQDGDFTPKCESNATHTKFWKDNTDASDEISICPQQRYYTLQTN